MSSEDFRKEGLGQLLQERRRELTPDEVGLPNKSHGRKRGLSIEETAVLARLSVRGYAMLEKGSFQLPRPETLDAVADALRMDEAMRADLFFLATEQRPSAPRRPPVAKPWHWGLARAYAPHPALVTDHVSTVLAYNGPAEALTDQTGAGPLDGRNLALWVFTDEAAKAVDDIGALRRSAIARLKAAVIRYHQDKALDIVVDRLQAIPATAKLWPRERARADRAFTVIRYLVPGHEPRELAWTRMELEDGAVLHTGLPHTAAPTDATGHRP
ncbi:MAG TPA: helix-turn-helix domain-containing protein [Yinghuangia sp.]|nr:helix-turn-helix domain-containing protein [Yinghuangia sp.]